MLITQNSIAAFIDEVTPGTFVPPVSYNIEIFELTPIEWNSNYSKKGKPANGNLTTAQSKSGKKVGATSGKTELLYTGDQGVAPKAGILYKNAGLKESGALTQIVYTYDGITNCDTMSMIQSDISCGTAPTSVDKKMRGIQSNMVISAESVGSEIMIEHTFSGAWEDEVDNASPVRTLTGIDTGACAKLLGSGFVIGTTPYALQSFSLDLGNAVTMRNDPASKLGVKQYIVTGSECKLIVKAEKIDIATSNIPADVAADTVFNPITIPLGDHWDLSITEANYSVDPKDSDNEGIISTDFEMEVRAFTLTQKD